MSLTIPAWVIPAMLTALCVAAMLRPYRPTSMFDVGGAFRILWLAPIGFIWAVYFGVALWLK